MPNYLSDPQLSVLDQNPEYKRRGHECPVCFWDGQDLEYPKKYWYKEQEYDCPEDEYGHVAWRLAKKYWLAFIPLEYQKLLWAEFPYPELAVNIDDYIQNFKRVRMEGIGWTFWSKTLGTGKTWAATQILRELVKQGYDCHFAMFMGMPSYYELDDKEERMMRMRRIREAEILVLDDVKMPISGAQRDFFEDKMEMLLRERSSANFPTIVTSNLSPEEFDHWYPRCYSLLSAKNAEVELNGNDWRKGGAWESNQVLALKGETRPIT